MKRLITFLLLQSHFASRQRPTDWTLVTALACTGLTIAAAVALFYYHRLDAID